MNKPVAERDSFKAASLTEELKNQRKYIANLQFTLTYDNIDEASWTAISTLIKKEKHRFVDQIHTGSIWFQEGKALWVTKIRTEQGEKYIYCKTKAGMYDKLYELYGGPIESITMQMLFERTLPQIRGRNGRISDNTRQEYFRLWNKYWKDVIGNQKVNDITRAGWRMIFEDVVKENNLTKKQFSNAVAILNHMMKYCLERDLITANPIKDIVGLNFSFKPEAARNTIKTEGLNAEQVRKVLEWCDMEIERPRVEKVYVYAMRFNIIYGLRFGELCGLMWSDIDLDSDRFTVRRQRCRQVCMTDDLTFKELQMQDLDHVKAYEEDRTLPLGEEGRKLIDMVKALNLPGEYVFPVRRNTYSGKIKKAAAYAGVKDLNDIHPHTLRACAAGNAYRKSGNVKIVQSLLGHRNPEMTYKYIKNIDAFDSLKAIL